MNYAVVDDASGKVVNVIVLDEESSGDFDPGQGMTLVQSDDAAIGYTWDGTNFIVPPPPPPPPQVAFSNAPIMGGTIREIITGEKP